MNNDIFRSTAFWKSAVMLMPDNSFFELLRSVFGKIKTPFNKQKLLNDLEGFLLREDIQKTIASYIDQTDAKIIAAAAVFEEPVFEQLENFFSGEFSSAQLQDIIVNLEERFILYRFTEEKKNLRQAYYPAGSIGMQVKNRLTLNPILKPVLQPIIEDTSALFTPPLTEKPDSSRAPKAKQTIINDFTLAALYSFILKHESFYKSETAIHKRIIDEGKTLFPGINLTSVLGALQILGLFYTEKNSLFPDKKYINDFCMLSARERCEYNAAALYVYKKTPPSAEFLPPLFKRKICDIVNLIHGFMNFLQTDSFYDEITLKRILEVLKAQFFINIDSEDLLDVMEKTGLITDGRVSQIKTSEDKPVIAIDSSFTILVYPEIKLIDAVKLASFLNLSEVNTVICYKLDKDSAVRAFNNGTSADEIIELLNRLVCKKIDDILIWNLKDWEKRHSEVSLKKGVILQLTKEHLYLTETASLSQLIKETLAPGVYLLNENTENEAAEALQKAGIDIIAQNKEKKENTVSINNHFPSLSSRKVEIFSAAPNETVKKNDYADLMADFHSQLEKMQLNEAERTELKARIDRRLVLSVSQLKDAHIRFEKLEARLMDYAGKQNIAKQAVSLQSPLEIVWTNKGNEIKVFGVPKALEKEGNSLTLVVDDNRIPLAKISLLRRIKKSIFES